MPKTDLSPLTLPAVMGALREGSIVQTPRDRGVLAWFETRSPTDWGPVDGAVVAYPALGFTEWVPLEDIAPWGQR